MQLPDKKKLFTAFLGLVAALLVSTAGIWCLNQADDFTVFVGGGLIFMMFLYLIDYFKFLRRIFCV